MSRVLAVDLSFAKSGWAVVERVDDELKVVDYALITSDKARSAKERIDMTVSELKLIAYKYNVDNIVKEASIIRQISSATNVIKTHAVFEHELSDAFEIADISNSSVKKWARAQINAQGTRKDKEMIAEAVESFYDCTFERMRTPRSRLIDDIADAIALATIYLTENSENGGCI